MFKLEMQVRDYECDLQGVVNNAVYQNYLEHSRHTFLREQQIDFSELAQQGVHLMLLSADLRFQSPLKPHDEFYITLELARESRIKCAFLQNIYLTRDDKLILTAKSIGLAVSSDGRPMRSELLDRLCP